MKTCKWIHYNMIVSMVNIMISYSLPSQTSFVVGTIVVQYLSSFDRYFRRQSRFLKTINVLNPFPSLELPYHCHCLIQVYFMTNKIRFE
jgi:hypothetical protein